MSVLIYCVQQSKRLGRSLRAVSSGCRVSAMSSSYRQQSTDYQLAAYDELLEQVANTNIVEYAI